MSSCPKCYSITKVSILTRPHPASHTLHIYFVHVTPPDRHYHPFLYIHIYNTIYIYTILYSYDTSDIKIVPVVAR